MKALSVVVLTLNEELHLPACLGSLSWAPDVVVLDSFSSDRTEAIAREYGARFVQHAFQGHGSQRNWALDHVPDLGEWVLFLDADERVPAELGQELLVVTRDAPPEVAAWRLRRRFHLWGRWLPRASLYPSWVVRLIRRGRVRYLDRGHAETQVVSGEVRELRNDLIDQNLRGIEAWFARQNRYSTAEALQEERDAAGSTIPGEVLGLLDRDPLERRAAAKRLASRLPFRGGTYFLYSYVLRGGFLEGRDGLALCLMRALYQDMIAVKRYDLRRGEADAAAPDSTAEAESA